MSETSIPEKGVEIQPAGSHGGGREPQLIDVSGKLMAWTWFSFAMMAIILYKAAWKPILKALDSRESSIRKALEDAEKARVELAAVEARSQKLMAEAQAKGQEIMDAARESASQIAETIRRKSESDARATVDDARREIEAAAEKARQRLLQEGARLAIDLAGKIMRENMDTARNKTLVDKLLKEVG